MIGSSSAVGGALALETAASFNIDIMFFSATGINDRGFIVDTSEEETELRAELLKNAATSIFLCDASKYGKNATYNIASLGDVSYLITNTPPPAHYPRPKKEIIVVE